MRHEDQRRKLSCSLNFVDSTNQTQFAVDHSCKICMPFLLKASAGLECKPHDAHQRRRASCDRNFIDSTDQDRLKLLTSNHSCRFCMHFFFDSSAGLESKRHDAQRRRASCDCNFVDSTNQARLKLLPSNHSCRFCMPFLVDTTAEFECKRHDAQ